MPPDPAEGSAPDPIPRLSTAEWCKDFCPNLPTRIENIVSEWNLTDANSRLVVGNILEAVRQSVLT